MGWPFDLLEEVADIVVAEAGAQMELPGDDFEGPTLRSAARVQREPEQVVQHLLEGMPAAPNL